MTESRENRIENLKELFFQSGKGISYRDLGREGALNRDALHPEERLGVLHASMIAQLILLCRTSLDQISVSLEIMRHMQFYGDDLFPEMAEYKREMAMTGVIVETFCSAVMQDMTDCKYIRRIHMGYIQECKELGQVNPYIEREAGQADKLLKIEWARFNETEDNIKFLMDRRSKKVPLFDKDQKPVLMDWQNPKLVMATLQQDTVYHMGQLADQSIEYAMTRLARMQLIHNRIIPVLPHLAEEWHEESQADHLRTEYMIKRVEALSEIHGRHLVEMNLRLA